MGDDESPTKPTIETLLERMGWLGDQIAALSVSLNDRLAGIEAHLHKIDKRISVLSEDVVNVRADLRLIEDKLTSKT